jgi:hypothetical protein
MTKKEAHEHVLSKVSEAGRDQWGRQCWRFGVTGRRYCGKNARERAIKQGHAILKKFSK